MIALCAECKTEMSDKARACPHCGAPNKSAPMGGGLKALLYAVGGLFGAAVLLTLYGVSVSPALTQAQKDAKIPAQIAIAQCRVEHCADYDVRVQDYQRTYHESP